jgi:hypothetical protein
MSGMMLLDFLAEARIEEAIAQGTLDNLPGVGRPLVLADDRLVPEGLRAAYRILLNARCAPPEVERTFAEPARVPAGGRTAAIPAPPARFETRLEQRDLGQRAPPGGVVIERRALSGNPDPTCPARAGWR